MADCNSIEQALDQIIQKLDNSNNEDCCDRVFGIEQEVLGLKDASRLQRIKLERLIIEFTNLNKNQVTDKTIPSRLKKLEIQVKAQIDFTAKLRTFARKTDNDFKFFLKIWSTKKAEWDKKNKDQDAKVKTIDEQLTAIKVALALLTGAGGALALITAKLAALLAKSKVVDTDLNRLQGQSARVKGAKGDRGAKGEDGAKGEKGTNGAKGADGDKGSNGAKGDKGTTGAKGAKGEMGEVTIVETEVTKLVYQEPDLTEVLEELTEIKANLIFNAEVLVNNQCDVDILAVETATLPEFMRALNSKLDALQEIICNNPDLEPYSLGSYSDVSTIDLEIGTKFIKITVSGFPDGIGKRFGRASSQPNNYPFGFVSFESAIGIYPEINWEWINSYFYPDKEMEVSRIHIYTRLPDIQYVVTGYKVIK